MSMKTTVTDLCLRAKQPSLLRKRIAPEAIREDFSVVCCGIDRVVMEIRRFRRLRALSDTWSISEPASDPSPSLPPLSKSLGWPRFGPFPTPTPRCP